MSEHDMLMLLWFLFGALSILIFVYYGILDTTGRHRYTDEEEAEIERYYNEHGTVPRWVITGKSPFRHES